MIDLIYILLDYFTNWTVLPQTKLSLGNCPVSWAGFLAHQCLTVPCWWQERERLRGWWMAEPVCPLTVAEHNQGELSSPELPREQTGDSAEISRSWQKIRQTSAQGLKGPRQLLAVQSRVHCGAGICCVSQWCDGSYSCFGVQKKRKKMRGFRQKHTNLVKDGKTCLILGDSNLCDMSKGRLRDDMTLMSYGCTDSRTCPKTKSFTSWTKV